MTGNAINAKSEALELDELSAEELEAVSGGLFGTVIPLSSTSTGRQQSEQRQQGDALNAFQQMLQEL
jgi:hypothetical protein